MYRIYSEWGESTMVGQSWGKYTNSNFLVKFLVNRDHLDLEFRSYTFNYSYWRRWCSPKKLFSFYNFWRSGKEQKVDFHQLPSAWTPLPPPFCTNISVIRDVKFSVSNGQNFAFTFDALPQNIRLDFHTSTWQAMVILTKTNTNTKYTYMY